MGFKFNPFTGTFDITGSGSSSADNFSYKTVASGVTVTVPTYQQMIVYREIDVIGTLNLNGDLVVSDL